MPGVKAAAATELDWSAVRKQLQPFVIQAIDSDRVGKTDRITQRVELDGHSYEISHVPDAGLSRAGRMVRKVCTELFGLCPRSYSRRIDLPDSIGRRIGTAILDLFRHRLRDAFDGPGVDMTVGLPSRARLIDAVFEDLYRRRARVLTDKAYTPDIADYTSQ